MIVLHQEHPSQCRVDVPYIYLRLTKDTLSKHIAKGYNHRGVWVLTVNTPPGSSTSVTVCLNDHRIES